MPFLRVIRDKRGYETTYLMHWYREGAKPRSRILYVFRTPGGARVGRVSLEPEIVRSIEVEHPDIQFDWKSILANKQIIESAPEPRRRKRKPAEGEAGTAAPVTRAEGPTAPPEGQPAPTPRFTVPAAMQGETQEERIAFLNHWYPLIRDRISLRTSDPTRRDALLALAERLNPAAWTDQEEISTGLERAGEALERLSRVFSRRRRRTRRSKPSGSTPSDQSAPPDA